VIDRGLSPPAAYAADVTAAKVRATRAPKSACRCVSVVTFATLA
jgi:hypothetical protein